jgi:hypothetical protein
LRDKVLKNLQIFGIKDITDIFKVKVGKKKVSIFEKYKKKKGIGKENAVNKEGETCELSSDVGKLEISDNLPNENMSKNVSANIIPTD